MKKFTQGHKVFSRTGAGSSLERPESEGVARTRPHRHVVSGSLALGVVGAVMVATALPVAAILTTTSTTAAPTTTSSTTTAPTTSTTLASHARLTPVLAQVRARSHGANQPSTPRARVRATHVVASRPKVSVVTRRAPTTVTTAPTKGVVAAVATTVPAKPAKRGPSAAAVALMAHLNPSTNIVPSPNFLSTGQCSKSTGAWVCENPCITSSMTWPTFSNGAACTNYLLAAINNARSVEGLSAMTLPSNWYTLTTAQQLFVVTDLERTARGLAPYLGINAALSGEAQRAANANADPGIAPGFAIGTDPQGTPGMGAAWSGGFAVLAADYIWMYDDGWGGSRGATANVACTSPAAAGCWAHRDELLGYDPGYNPGVGLDATTVEVGVGFAIVGGSSSFTVLAELPKGPPPAMTFTWANDVAPFL
jgi:hypothetical protein